MIAVTLVYQEGEAALVQWVERGKLKRTIVPHSSMQGGKVPADELAAGLPHGEDWAKAVKGVTPLVAKTLKNYGIWTKEDALASPRHVREAVMTGYVPVIVEAIRKYAEED